MICPHCKQGTVVSRDDYYRRGLKALGCMVCGWMTENVSIVLPFNKKAMKSTYTPPGSGSKDFTECSTPGCTTRIDLRNAINRETGICKHCRADQKLREQLAERERRLVA